MIQDIPVLALLIGFVAGCLIMFLAMKNVKDIEQMTREEYRRCVALIIVQYADESKRSLALLEELNRYDTEIKIDLHNLSEALQAIVKEVTNKWE